MCCGDLPIQAQQKAANNRQSNGVAVNANLPKPFTPNPNESDNTNMQRALALRENQHKARFGNNS